MLPLVGRLSLPHRAGIALRWPLGITYAAWRHLTRSESVHRSTTTGDRSDLPDPIPARYRDDRLQTVSDGVGPLLHRHYALTVDGATVDPAALLGDFAAHPHHDAPRVLATFVKTRGADGVAALGDEFSVRMPGPWNGPVRVIGLTSTSMRLATLSGHLEAGQIEFRARTAAGALVVEIESWARPGDVLSDLLYNGVGIAREVQLILWVETLLQLAAHSGGHVRDGVRVSTRQYSDRTALADAP